MTFNDFGYSISIIRQYNYNFRVIITNENMKYLGVIEILELHKTPGFQQPYGLSRKNVPVIHLHKGILQHAKDIAFNSFNLANEYSDLVIWFVDGCGLSIDIENNTLTLYNTDSNRSVIEL